MGPWYSFTRMSDCYLFGCMFGVAKTDLKFELQATIKVKECASCLIKIDENFALIAEESGYL